MYISPVNSFSLPNQYRNYCVADNNKVQFFVNEKERALPYLNDILVHSNNEQQVTETLYILDRMIDAGVKDVDKMYPTLSRFNETKSPNIQTFLAGIYRKIQVQPHRRQHKGVRRAYLFCLQRSIGARTNRRYADSLKVSKAPRDSF